MEYCEFEVAKKPILYDRLYHLENVDIHINFILNNHIAINVNLIVIVKY